MKIMVNWTTTTKEWKSSLFLLLIFPSFSQWEGPRFAEINILIIIINVFYAVASSACALRRDRQWKIFFFSFYLNETTKLISRSFARRAVLKFSFLSFNAFGHLLALIKIYIRNLSSLPSHFLVCQPWGNRIILPKNIE
jgi:hypothetical protein